MVSGPIADSFCPLILEDLPPDRIYYSGLYAGTDLFLPGDKGSSIFKQAYLPFLYSSVTTQVPLAKTSAPGLPLHKIKPPSITIKMRLPYPSRFLHVSPPHPVPTIQLQRYTHAISA